LLSHSVCRIFGVIEYKSISEYVSMCQLNNISLASEVAELLDFGTLDDDLPFKKINIHECGKLFSFISLFSNWISLFLQYPPGCWKTEAACHFSSNRRFNSHTPVYSDSSSAETSIEQFLGSQVF
jgi:hypothetical protein